MTGMPRGLENVVVVVKVTWSCTQFSQSTLVKVLGRL